MTKSEIRNYTYSLTRNYCSAIEIAERENYNPMIARYNEISAILLYIENTKILDAGDVKYLKAKVEQAYNNFWKKPQHYHA